MIEKGNQPLRKLKDPGGGGGSRFHQTSSVTLDVKIWMSTAALKHHNEIRNGVNKKEIRSLGLTDTHYYI